MLASPTCFSPGTLQVTGGSYHPSVAGGPGSCSGFLLRQVGTNSPPALPLQSVPFLQWGTKELALPPSFCSSLPPKVLVPSFPLFTNYLWTVVLFFLFNVHS